MLPNLRLRILTTTLALAAFGTACPAEEETPEGGSGSGGETSTGFEATETASEPSTGEDPSSDDGTSSSGADSSSGEPEPACDCVAEVDGFVQFTCEAEEICEPVQVSCDQEPPTDCALTDFVVDNPEVLPCHHDALVAGTPGMLRWEAPNFSDPGAAGQRAWIVIAESREAITWHEAWGEPTYAFSDTAVSMLRAAEHFDGCMQLPSAEETFRCLYDAAEEQLGVCIPAYELPFG